jgi:flagellar basal body-associated protein FliL
VVSSSSSSSSSSSLLFIIVVVAVVVLVAGCVLMMDCGCVRDFTHGPERWNRQRAGSESSNHNEPPIANGQWSELAVAGQAPRKKEGGGIHTTRRTW